MGLGDQFQTIFYYEDTGEIREILPNQYVKSRKNLNMLINMPESHGIKFFYVHGSFPIDTTFYKVKLGTKAKPPRLVGLDGKDPSLGFIRDESIFTLKSHDSILIRFEGGMGDYMDQADVAIQLQKDYPEKKFYVEIQHANRKAALEMIDGWKGIQFYGGNEELAKKMGKIEMNYISKVPGYAPTGKIGVYSTIGGMKEPVPRSKILTTPADKEAAHDLIGIHTAIKKPFLVILHTVSGPANSKSIPPDTVVRLLSSLLKNKDLVFCHIGGAGETVVDHPQIISLQGKLPWEKIFALMSIARGCICIDSSIMHIAQHLPIPVISFWGPTDPLDILGENPGITTIRTITPCKGCGLWNCEKGYCMKQFDKKEVAAAFETLRRKV